MSMVEHCILAEKTLGKVCPKFVPFETAHDDFLKDCGKRLRPLPNLDVPPHITERLLNHIDGEIADVAAIYNRSRAAWNCWIRSFGSIRRFCPFRPFVRDTSAGTSDRWSASPPG
jgi:hypothetical protein